MKKNRIIGSGTMMTLASENPDAENTLDNPDLIKPVESGVKVDGNQFSTTMKPYSFVVMRFDLVNK